MKKSNPISIPTPCHKNWNEMRPIEQGRFCNSCAKSVIDVSGWSNDKINKEYKKHGNNLCIRIPAEQLNNSANIKKNSISAWRWLLVVLAIWGAKFQQLFAQVPPPPVEHEDSVKCENTLRIYGKVKHNKGLKDDPLAFASIRVMNGDSLLAGSYTMADGNFSIEIPRSKLDSLKSVTLLILTPDFSPVSKTLFLADTIHDPKLRPGDLTLKEQIFYLTDIIRLPVRSPIIMGSMVYTRSVNVNKVRSVPNFTKKTDNNQTYSQQDLQRYNFR